MQSDTFSGTSEAPVVIRKAGWPRMVYGLRVLPRLTGEQTAEVAYASLRARYTVKTFFLSSDITTRTEEFAIDGSSFFEINVPGGPRRVGGLDVQLINVADGYEYEVWIAETFEDAINLGASYGKGVAPGARTLRLTQEVWSVEDANTLGPESGIDLSNAVGLNVTVRAQAGSTIDATGSLSAYRQDDGVWSAMPQADIPLGPPNPGGVPAIANPGLDIPVGAGRLAYLPNAMALTGGGTTVTIRYQAAIQ